VELVRLTTRVLSPSRRVMDAASGSLDTGQRNAACRTGGGCADVVAAIYGTDGERAQRSGVDVEAVFGCGTGVACRVGLGDGDGFRALPMATMSAAESRSVQLVPFTVALRGVLNELLKRSSTVAPSAFVPEMVTPSAASRSLTVIWLSDVTAKTVGAKGGTVAQC